jgi:hypothetical protein
MFNFRYLNTFLSNKRTCGNVGKFLWTGMEVQKVKYSGILRNMKLYFIFMECSRFAYSKKRIP